MSAEEIFVMTLMHLLLSAFLPSARLCFSELTFLISWIACLKALLTPPPHLSLSLKVQENVFVEFNHQELLEFYNKVCFTSISSYTLISCVMSVLHMILIGRHCLTRSICLFPLYFETFCPCSLSVTIPLWLSFLIRVFLLCLFSKHSTCSCFLPAWNRARPVGFLDLMPGALCTTSHNRTHMSFVFLLTAMPAVRSLTIPFLLWFIREKCQNLMAAVSFPFVLM